jgi:putative ABC transport system permease protein
MWALTKRSLRVNRSQLLGALIALTVSIAMLTAAGTWLAAGLTDSRLDQVGTQLATVAGSFIGIAALIAGFTVASATATGLRERRRQFALLQAIGATKPRVRNMVLLETALVVAAAAPLGAAAGYGLSFLSNGLLTGSGLVPSGYVLPVEPTAALQAIAVMLTVALVAAWSASRQATRVGAAEAVRAAGVESSTLSTGRRIGAGIVAATGAVAAVMPLILPGMIGVAFATMSTFLLVTALAMVGPVISAGVATRLARMVPQGSALQLPLANVRGFSRRLTALVVPFALVAALGAVQLSTNAIVADAGREQIAAGYRSTLAGTTTAADTAVTIRALPSVTAVTVLSGVSGEVQTDQDPDMPFQVWEPATITTVTGDTDSIDPGVTAGNLRSLHGDDTIAVSADTLLGSGAHVGSTIGVRLDGHATKRTIVAIYDRSLGFGDYILPATTTTGTLLVTTDDVAAVSKAAAAAGITLTTPGTYAKTVAASGDQTLSSVLLFALLLFALLAAVNTLVTVIRSRKDEFALLTRTGATRVRLVRTAVVEILIAALLATLLGALTAVPAAAGAAAALLSSWPTLPWGAIGILLVALPVVATGTALIAVSTIRRGR